MLQLKNHSTFGTKITVFPDEQGVDTLFVLMQATFNIGNPCELLAEQAPPGVEDEYWGDPASSSLKKVAAFHGLKPATDIALIGHAWAPVDQPQTVMDVSLTIAELSNTIRVFGDRYWDAGNITAPQPFTSMPLLYEKAYGGTHSEDNAVLASNDFNPVGCGFVGQRQAEQLNGLALPNLESPQNLIQAPGDIIDPVGFGFIAPSWQPRLSYAGTYDEVWQAQRAPYLPEDFDKQFYNMAHPAMIYPGFLQGGERVILSGVNPHGDVVFDLPKVAFDVVVHIKNKQEKLNMQLETLLIESDDLQFTMNWKAALACDKAVPDIRQIDIHAKSYNAQQAA